MARDELLRKLARDSRGLITREMALNAGATDRMIETRVNAGHWTAVHAGVYFLGVENLTWEQRLVAACFAGGPAAVASHRAAPLVWGLDGLATAPVEITMPYGCLPNPAGAIVHRSRRLDQREMTVRDGIPVTTVERTLIDLARFVPPVVFEQAFESAVRKGLASTVSLGVYLEERGRGLPGWRTADRYLRARPDGRPAGSPAEVRFLHLLRKEGVPDPARQFEVELPEGDVFVLDFAWPRSRFAVEWHGYDVHSGRRTFEAGLDRVNRLHDIGWQLRQYSGAMLRSHPARIVASVLRGLQREL